MLFFLSRLYASSNIIVKIHKSFVKSFNILKILNQSIAPIISKAVRGLHFVLENVDYKSKFVFMMS
jgi:hypothetical protein